MIIVIQPSDRDHKKYKISGRDKKGRFTVHVGDDRYEDFTKHKDMNKKRQYILRHLHNNDSINRALFNYRSAAFWALHLLWNKKTLHSSIAHTLDRLKEITGEEVRYHSFL